MGDVTGKTVLITGASRGIGEATARLFAREGANVVLTARSEAVIDEIALDIGENAMSIPCDVSKYGHMRDAVEHAIGRFGRLDILIGNAGVIEPVAMLAESDPEAWGDAIDINLKGVYHGMRAAMPHMLKQGHGTIITISSGAAHNALEGWSHYCASKAGAAMMTKAAHVEGAAKGLRVMGLSPGTVATQMQREIKASGVNPVSEMNWEDHIPAEWPARTLLWMCSAAADPFLGQELALRDEGLRRTVGLI
ncbi:MAG: SDR family oxidoreductase [Lentibacter sp.]|uniref:SDR family oxidoreductase n=1 Tax=Lentibacter sp. TaxID=2024994 RepID=UPI002627B1F8|nr:SDR family oxidoreductase [Lentibacter sp.]MDG1288459.1 SDR family oxidoreductase [Lentibacter sp.]